MRMSPNVQSTSAGGASQMANKPGAYPPAFLEYAWYASLAYAYLGGVWGIVVPAVGGAILVVLAAACVLHLGDRAISLCKPVAWAFYTAISLLAIEVMFHDIGGKAILEITAFVQWLAVLIIVQTLSLRPNFLHRFALAALAIGVASLPYINVRSVGGVMRAWASGTAISNPNVLGMWFGFCTVYFIFWGLQCRTPLWRAGSWAVAVGSFFIVALTVSRAPLLGIVLACIVGFRSALKQNFLPVLLFVLAVGLVYISGVFDEELGYYASRGAEESGRGRLWPAAVERILESPWVGGGLGNIGIQTRSGHFMNPHNPVLHIALGAGFLPVFFFLGYLARVALGARNMMQKMQVAEAALLPPMVVFGLFEIMTLDLAFMMPWVVVVFGLVSRASQKNRYQGLSDRQDGNAEAM